MFKLMGVKLNTDGRGFWSAHTREVRCKHMELLGEKNIAELRVFFNKRDWNVTQHGLIYTDILWLKELRKHLLTLGFSDAAVKSIDYSEQGMQGDDYVSCDVGHVFIDEWNKLTKERPNASLPR